MQKWSYILVGLVVITIIMNFRLCCAKNTMLVAPYMQTSTAQMIDNIHYARVICDDIVLRVQDISHTKQLVDMVDFCIARMAIIVSNVALCKYAEEKFRHDDMVYISSIMHSIVYDLNMSFISVQQQKAVFFMTLLLHALLLQS